MWRWVALLCVAIMALTVPLELFRLSATAFLFLLEQGKVDYLRAVSYPLEMLTCIIAFILLLGVAGFAAVNIYLSLRLRYMEGRNGS